MTDPIYPTLTAPVRLSRGDILALIDVLDTAVSTRLTLARGIEDDATGAREGDPEWAAVLDRQARRERDRATRLASLRDRIGGSGMSLIQAPLRSGDATVRSREAIEAAAGALEGAMHMLDCDSCAQQLADMADQWRAELPSAAPDFTEVQS